MNDSKITDTTSLPNKTHRSIFCAGIVILAALIMLAYGAAFNLKTIVAEDDDDSATEAVQAKGNNKPPVSQVDKIDVLMLSEPKIIREVTIGGLIRLPTGMLKRTYSGQSPSLCPT